MGRLNYIIVSAIIFLTGVWQPGYGQWNKKKSGFNAPVIYSLSNDTNAIAGESSKVPTITPANPVNVLARKDTVFIVKQVSDSNAQHAMNTAMNTKLDSIQSQVAQVSKVLFLQSFEARYQQLVFQKDSILQRKARLASQKVSPSEYNLQSHIYNLQADSIRQEMRRLENYWDKGVYNWDSIASIQSGNRIIINEPVLPAVAEADSSADVQLKIIEAKLAQARNSEQYKSDTVYQAQTEAIAKELDRYAPGHARLAAGDSMLRMQGDSLQVEMKKELDSLRQGVQKNTDSLQQARKVLQQSRDSSAFYRDQLVQQQKIAAADSVQNRKFFNRLLRGGAEKKKLEENERIENSYNERSAYYDRQVEILNDKVDRLQKRNNTLSGNYRDVERRPRYRVQSYPAPAATIAPVIIPANNNAAASEDIRQLREQMNLLSVQLQSNRSDSNKIKQPDTLGRQANENLASLQQSFSQLETRFSRYKDSVGTRIDSLQANAIRAAKTSQPAPVPQPVKKDPVAIPIYFENGSSVVTSLQRQKLTRFMQEQANNNARFTLAGYTDATGSAALNNALAAKRVERIESLLVTGFAIPAGNIRLLDPVTSNHESKVQSPLDRKVVVSIQQN